MANKKRYFNKRQLDGQKLFFEFCRYSKVEIKKITYNSDLLAS